MKRAVWISGGVALTAVVFGLFIGPGKTPRASNERPQTPKESEPRPSQVPAFKPQGEILAVARASTQPPKLDVQAPEDVAADPTAEDESRRSAAEQAQLARLPLLTAIRGDYLSQQARYDAMLEALERSGATDEPWSRQATEVLTGWGTALGQAAGNADLAGIRCFVAGCQMRVTFQVAASAERAAAAFRLIPEETATHGGRVQTPAVTAPEGGVQVTWMMLRPDIAPPPAGTNR